VAARVARSTAAAAFACATTLAALVPSHWVLRARVPDVSIYLDSTRVDRSRGDTTQVWLLYDFDTLMRSNNALIKQMEVHAGLLCLEGRVRALHVNVYGEHGVVIGQYDIASGTSLRQIMNTMIHNAVVPVCAWLRDPRSPPVVLAH
jgi:hypothetical protein